ncbi:MAG: DUF86 domain-containing protein [bacterium]
MMIDRDRINKNNLDIIRILGQIEILTKYEMDVFLGDFRNIQSLKYLLIQAVESIVDTCQHILAKTKGIACEGYVDCIVKAGKEDIIPSALSDKLRKLCDLRNSIIHRYWIIDDTKLYTQTVANKGDLKEFVDFITYLLKQENDKEREKRFFLNDNLLLDISALLS